MSDFYTSVKSTIDKVAVDIANGLEIGFVELDDTVNIEDALESNDDLVVYQMIGMVEDPTDPLWALSFSIGAKTTTDAANYDLADIISKVHKVVFKGETFQVADYGEVLAPSTYDGYFYVTDVQVDSQMFDGMTGIRMLNIQARAVRTV